MIMTTVIIIVIIPGMMRLCPHISPTTVVLFSSRGAQAKISMILYTIVADENEEHLRRNPGIIYWQICQPASINMCTSYCVFSRVQTFVELTSLPRQSGNCFYILPTIYFRIKSPANICAKCEYITYMYAFLEEELHQQQVPSLIYKYGTHRTLMYPNRLSAHIEETINHLNNRQRNIIFSTYFSAHTVKMDNKNNKISYRV